MLARRECEKWSLTPSEERNYDTEAEARFFTAIENPPRPTKHLEDIYRAYGKFLQIGSAPCVYLGMIGTQQKYQGNGIGKTLMLHALQQTLEVAKLVGIYALVLDAVDQETACRYEQ